MGCQGRAWVYVRWHVLNRLVPERMRGSFSIDAIVLVQGSVWHVVGVVVDHFLRGRIFILNTC